MIMISYKTKAMGFAGDGTVDGGSNPAEKLLEQLREALGTILDAARNYASAFEAVGGMRGLFCSRLLWEVFILMRNRSN